MLCELYVCVCLYAYGEWGCGILCLCCVLCVRCTVLCGVVQKTCRLRAVWCTDGVIVPSLSHSARIDPR